MIPSISDLQRLFPVGPIELDAQARRELASISAVCYMFTALKKHGTDETTYQEVDRRVVQRFLDTDNVKKCDIHAAQIEELAKMMDAADSVMPGIDHASVQDQQFMLKIFVDYSKEDPRFGAMLLAAAVADEGGPVAMHAITAGTLATLQGLMRNVVIQFLYRQHPGVRFPIQHLLQLVLDPGDDGQPVSATINGYSLDILQNIKSSQVFKAPDTAEEFLRGCTNQETNGGSPTPTE
jgi:hypothetical protein